MCHVWPWLACRNLPSEVFVVKYSDDGKYIASGLGDGSIRVRIVVSLCCSAGSRGHGWGLWCGAPPVRDRGAARHLCSLTTGPDSRWQVLNTATGHTHVLGVGAGSHMPVTSLRFRPVSTASKTKNVLLAVGACWTCRGQCGRRRHARATS